MLAGQISAGERSLGTHHLPRRSLGGDFAAPVAGAGPEVEKMVGGGDHFAVMLDKDQRVAKVAETIQRSQQPAVVARVQTDGRLVEHVEHAGQSAADLTGKSNALRLAAGQRWCRPAQSQIIQADIDQELQAVRDFAKQLAGHLLLILGQLELLEQLQRLPERQIAQAAQRAVHESESGGIVAQSRPAARHARYVADEVLELMAVDEAHPRCLVNGREQALVLKTGSAKRRARSAISSRSALHAQLDPSIARAVQDRPLVGRFQFLERGIQ